MKIGILTFHYAYNYGALMQAWAMKEFLKTKGFDVEFVNHKNKAIEKYYSIYDWKYIKSKSVIRLLIKISLYPFILIARFLRYRKFEAFIKQEFPINLKRDNIDCYDILIVGSDQVWNYELTDGFDAYYWGNINPNNKIYIAYAVSMNMNNFKQKDEVGRFLNNFSAISVREKSLQNQLSILTNKKIELVSDPTLLITFSMWNKIIRRKSIKDKEYVLAYPLRDSKEVIVIAQQLASRNKVHLSIISGGVNSNVLQKQKIFASPYEFITLIANSNKVVTSSFHGTILSIIFNKDFYSIRAKDKNNVRIESLLEILGLSDRLINSYEEALSLPTINYAEVNKKLEKLRNHSTQYLLSSIKGYLWN